MNIEEGRVAFSTGVGHGINDGRVAIRTGRGEVAVPRPIIHQKLPVFSRPVVKKSAAAVGP